MEIKKEIKKEKRNVINSKLLLIKKCYYSVHEYFEDTFLFLMRVK